MTKERVLLHVCCAPCSMNVIEELKHDYFVELLFYNPNIHPAEEYYKRKQEVVRYSGALNIKFHDMDFHPEEFYSRIEGLENEKEGGIRCHECFRIRLQKTALKAQELGISQFTTTLTVSPHKKSGIIFTIADEITNHSGITFLKKDFKKKDGFKKTMQLAKANDIYIQNYCGCEFSLSPDRMLTLAAKK
mgnify:FL=1